MVNKKYRIVETGQGFKIQSLKHSSLFGFFKSSRWVDLVNNYRGRDFRCGFYEFEYQAKDKITSWEFKERVVYEH